MKSIENPDQFLENAARLAVAIHVRNSLDEGKPLAADSSDEDLYDPEKAIKQAKAQLDKAVAKRAICAALESGNADLKELTKTAGAALLPLALGGAITLPLTPIAFAAAGLILFRMGVASYCADVRPLPKG